MLKELRQRRLGGWLCLLACALYLTTAFASPQRGGLSTGWSHDAVGRVTAQTTGSFSYGFGHDARHRRTSRSASSGVDWYDLEYDAQDRLTSVRLTDGTTLNYQYDARGNRLAGGSAATTYTVNALNQATARSTSSAGRGYGVYGTVAPGARVRVFHPGTIDPEGEELAVDPVTGAYSAWWSAGGTGVLRVEMLVRGTLPGGGTQGRDAVSDEAVWVLVPAVSEAFVYDDAGRLIEDGTWVYTWNAASHLTGLTRKAGTSADPHVASESISYGYDSDGRRTGRVHTVTKTGGQTEVAVSKVLWDGWLPVCEERTVNGAALAKRWFVWGSDVSGSLGGAGGIGGLVSIIEEGGRTLLPVDDGLGNITAVIDAATGNAVARYDYGPYGEIVGESGDIEACPFRYQSKWWDAAAGLNYFGYRHYSPRLGRWLSRDPLGEEGGMNLYAYCEGDPVNKYDYLGMFTPDGVISAFSAKYGGDEKAMMALFAIMSRYEIKQGSFWFDDWSVDHSSGAINIASTAWLGSERSNENAADQLYQIISDDSDFYKLSGLPETWGGFGRRVGGGVGETVGGAVSVVGGAALVIAPEPTLTKVGGVAAVTFGSNAVVSGVTSIFNGRDGGYDPLNNLAGAYGQYMNGDAGEASARYWMSWAELFGQGPGMFGKSKIANLPMRQVPGATKVALEQAWQKFTLLRGGAANRGASWFDDVATNATRNADSNKLVLGHFATEGTSYQKVAAHYKATYFKVDNWKAITKGLSQDEIWRINETFLKQQLRQGKQILFSHNPLTARANSFFEREVNFLRRLGYSFRQTNQWTWEAFR